MPVIRAARADELPGLRDLEDAAGRIFAAAGMPEIAADEPKSVAELEEFRAAGHAWVAVDADDRPVAYLIAATVDGCAHIEQVSVAPTHAHRRIGAALIDHLAAHAAARGIPALTLTTFADIPWNAPYYRRLGFTTLEPAAQGPELRALMRREAEEIPGNAPRIAMHRPVAERVRHLPDGTSAL